MVHLQLWRCANCFTIVRYMDPTISFRDCVTGSFNFIPESSANMGWIYPKMISVKWVWIWYCQHLSTIKFEKIMEKTHFGQIHSPLRRFRLPHQKRNLVICSSPSSMVKEVHKKVSSSILLQRRPSPKQASTTPDVRGDGDGNLRGS
jgi:hypothetical protein